MTLCRLQDRKPLVNVEEMPQDLLNKVDKVNASTEYPMETEEVKAQFLKACWVLGFFQKCSILKWFYHLGLSDIDQGFQSNF